jgi:hypothetical protein
MGGSVIQDFYQLLIHFKHGYSDLGVITNKIKPR